MRAVAGHIVVCAELEIKIPATVWQGFERDCRFIPIIGGVSGARLLKQSGAQGCLWVLFGTPDEKRGAIARGAIFRTSFPNLSEYEIFVPQQKTGAETVSRARLQQRLLNGRRKSRRRVVHMCRTEIFLRRRPRHLRVARWVYANKMFRNNPRRRCRNGVLTNLQSPYGGTHSENFQIMGVPQIQLHFPEIKFQDISVLRWKRASLQRRRPFQTRACSAKCGFEKERGFALKAPRGFAAIVRPDFYPLFRARNILP